LPLAAISTSFSYAPSVGPLGNGISLSQSLYVFTGFKKQIRRFQTSMLLVGFETLTSALERAKTAHFFGTLRRVALVRTDVSEERIVSTIRVTKIVELGNT
jgi:hypothetical protein